MKISIENYRGIKSATFQLEGITLVAAQNAAGKSAVAQAAGAVLSGQPMPIPGVPKTMAGMLVRSGASAGFAQLDTDTGVGRVDWPRAAMKTKGTPPQISAIAAGIELLSPHHGSTDDAAKQKRRAEMLIDLLNAHPVFEHLRARFAREGINEETARATWAFIEKQGWPAAHVQAKETGARLKGQWEAVSGENYGSKKAEAFTPNEWEPELAGASLEALQAAVTDARDAVEGMIAVAAIDDAERDRLQALADSVAELQTAHKVADTEFRQGDKERADAESIQRTLRNPDAVSNHKCPHCSGDLSIAGAKIVAGSIVTVEEKNIWDTAHQKIAAARKRAEELRQAMQVSVAKLNEAEGAAKELEKLSGANASQDQVNSARSLLQVAQLRLSAFEKKTKADRLQASILQNASITTALDTGGIRQEVVSESISRFLSERIAPLAAVAGWHGVDVSADMALQYGGRAWSVLAESERYRVRVLLQVGAAMLQQASAVVIDAADILDRAGRNGLMNLLRHNDVPAIVCMTFPAPTVVPDLQAAGIGASYWIADGELKPLAISVGAND